MPLEIVFHTLALVASCVSTLFQVLRLRFTQGLLAPSLTLTHGAMRNKIKIRLLYHFISCTSMILNFSPRMVVFSNNGHIGHCPRWKFILAQIFNFFRRYTGLRSIGSYPIKF